MSLFKTKEIWFQPGNPLEEAFSVNSLSFFPSNDLVTNDSGNTDLILTASLNGILRLFHVIPSATSDSDIEPQNVDKASSLLLETSMNQPILQIDVGNFSR